MLFFNILILSLVHASQQTAWPVFGDTATHGADIAAAIVSSSLADLPLRAEGEGVIATFERCLRGLGKVVDLELGETSFLELHRAFGAKGLGQCSPVGNELVNMADEYRTELSPQPLDGAPREGLVFQIGFNKAATRSIRAFYCRSLDVPTPQTGHYFVVAEGVSGHKVAIGRWLTENMARGAPILHGLSNITYFGDAGLELCDANTGVIMANDMGKVFDVVDEYYPGSQFILNVRKTEEWVLSRIGHVQGVCYGSFYKQHPWAATAWVLDLHIFYSHVLEYFSATSERSRRLLILDVDEPTDWEALCRFLKGGPRDSRPGEPCAAVPHVKRKKTTGIAGIAGGRHLAAAAGDTSAALAAGSGPNAAVAAAALVAGAATAKCLPRTLATPE